MRLIRMICILVISLLLWPAAAQDDPESPLLNMLRLVPDNEQTRAGTPLVSYADYRAIEVGRGIDAPLTRADFDNRTEAASLWIAATNGVASGLPLANFMQYLQGMQAAVGFAWFDIDRALTFGQPPNVGNLLVGDFDADAITAAFEARGFTMENQDDVAIWCGPDGCEEGLTLNLSNRDPANPFGGNLGRSEPVALLPGYIANAADFAVFSAILAAYQGEQPSLADDPTVQAAAHSIAGKGTLRQAHLFNGTDIGLAPDPAETPPPDANQTQALPVYALAFFADLYDDEEQIALVGLVYDDAETAKTAAQRLTGNLQTAQSIRTQRPFLDAVEERGGSVADVYVVPDAATGQFVTLLDIRYPTPPNERLDTGYTASSLVFRLLIDSVYSRDVGWLQSGFAAP